MFAYGTSIQGHVYLLGEMGPRVLRMFLDPLCRESPGLLTEPTQEIGRLQQAPIRANTKRGILVTQRSFEVFSETL